jgi:sugar phosphate isomerase/epimerase
LYVSPTDGRLQELLATLVAAGLTHVGFDGVNWLDGAYPTPWDDPPDTGAVGRAAAAARRHGLAVETVHSPVSLVRPGGDAERNLRDNRAVLDAAADAGARSTVWHFETYRAPDGEHVARDVVGGVDPSYREQVVRRTCEHAAERDVVVALENVPRTRGHDPARIAEWVRERSLPNCGLCLDVGHATACGHDPAAAVRAAGDLLVDTHVQDNHGARGVTPADPLPERATDNDEHLAPGIGTTDWRAVCGALADAGYERPPMFELSAGSLGAEPADRVEEFRRVVSLTTANWRAFTRSRR